MLFYDYEDCLCAYIRNRGFVCVDADSPRFDERLPAHTSLTTCDEAAPYTNPYGDVLLAHEHLPHDMCYNTVLQELVPEDWPNMFSVEDGERNPYTEMLYGDVRVDLTPLVDENPWIGCRISRHGVWLSYNAVDKTIRVTGYHDDAARNLFCMEKHHFIRTYQVRCVD
jgi:hypothetical protein